MVREIIVALSTNFGLKDTLAGIARREVVFPNGRFPHRRVDAEGPRRANLDALAARLGPERKGAVMDLTGIRAERCVERHEDDVGFLERLTIQRNGPRDFELFLRWRTAWTTAGRRQNTSQTGESDPSPDI